MKKKGLSAERRFPAYPHVRQAYGKDITEQEFCQVTGASDFDRPGDLSKIVVGEWSNNWLAIDEERDEF